MQSEEVLKQINAFYRNRIALMKAKTHDYAGDNDFFHCFEKGADVAGVSVPQTMLWEIERKLIRIGNVLRLGNEVDEDVLETVTDIANYVDYLYVYLENNRER